MECLCFQGKEKLQRSMVADNESGKSVMSEVHTSSGMFLDIHPVVAICNFCTCT